MEVSAITLKQRTLELHKGGMNGAQAILQAYMEAKLIPDFPQLIEMTKAWKGGIGGDTCSAFAGATLIIGFYEETRDENLKKLNNWYQENYDSISCPTITAAIGGRPSPRQKVFCDDLSAETAEYLFNLIKGE